MTRAGIATGLVWKFVLSGESAATANSQLSVGLGRASFSGRF
jgi:hypothetical protein